MKYEVVLRQQDTERVIRTFTDFDKAQDFVGMQPKTDLDLFGYTLGVYVVRKGKGKLKRRRNNKN